MAILPIVSGEFSMVTTSSMIDGLMLGEYEHTITVTIRTSIDTETTAKLLNATSLVITGPESTINWTTSEMKAHGNGMYSVGYTPTGMGAIQYSISFRNYAGDSVGVVVSDGFVMPMWVVLLAMVCTIMMMVTVSMVVVTFRRLRRRRKKSMADALLSNFHRGSQDTGTYQTFGSDGSSVGAGNDNTDDSRKVVIDRAAIRILRKNIDSGGQAHIHLGRWEGVSVVIKRFHTSPTSTEEMERMSISEAHIHYRMRHPNVVRLYGVCLKPSFALIMEFVSRGSLYSCIQSCVRGDSTFPPPDPLKTALMVARGMAYLHRSGVIHRDLKSPNILIGEDGTAKIADFGTARQLAVGTMTVGVGSVRWQAPEVISSGKYGKEADVYGFGIIIWELLSLRVPFDHLHNAWDVRRCIESGIRPDLDHCRRGASRSRSAQSGNGGDGDGDDVDVGGENDDCDSVMLDEMDRRALRDDDAEGELLGVGLAPTTAEMANDTVEPLLINSEKRNATPVSGDSAAEFHRYRDFGSDVGRTSRTRVSFSNDVARSGGGGNVVGLSDEVWEGDPRWREELIKLMVTCWEHDRFKRPPFERFLVGKLEALLDERSSYGGDEM
eukprot:TRINITY_DN4548_c0_g1_i1.p1 TRINITY_DN4548_c0_g1~~TRINITY_DN4548_c0_g1_i1.p1  ORF type:complete len:608 (-),score=128.07 TRINITY_DN4548_c0_g1_i1:3-1826(-)